MTFRTHLIQDAIPGDLHHVVVYTDVSQASHNTIKHLRDYGPDDVVPLFVPTHAALDDLPYHMQALIPPPPVDDLEFPIVVVAYQGDLVSWTGHDLSRLEAWVTEPDSVKSYLTRSHDLAGMHPFDEGYQVAWDIPLSVFKGEPAAAKDLPS